MRVSEVVWLAVEDVVVAREVSALMRAHAHRSLNALLLSFSALSMSEKMIIALINML
jgi:hypothetical protein